MAKRSQRKTIRQTLPDLQSKAELIMAPADFFADRGPWSGHQGVFK
jgi:hypothetical protein